ncbi:UNVERIFIED_CONTAM: hypothetical protein FKN15_009302 [Acipenser sinensis]
MITEKQQKHCMLFQFSPTTIAGIASSILLFMVFVSTLVCCFMCSCCYLYQRWQQMRTPHQGQHIQMTSYPRDFTYPTQCKPAGGPGDPYPGAQHYHPATMPPHSPSAAPPAPYPPADQGYGYGVAGERRACRAGITHCTEREGLCLSMQQAPVHVNNIWRCLCDFVLRINSDMEPF